MVHLMDNMLKQHITQTILEAGRLKNFFSFNFLPKFLFQGKPGDFLHFSTFSFDKLIHTCFVNIDMLTNHTNAQARMLKYKEDSC